MYDIKFVIPVKTGIYIFRLDPSLRWDDDWVTMMTSSVNFEKIYFVRFTFGMDCYLVVWII